MDKNKIVAINREAYTPRIFLAELMDTADQMENILAIVEDKDGHWRIGYSNSGIEDLCLFSKMLDEHITNKLNEMTVDSA